MLPLYKFKLFNNYSSIFCRGIKGNIVVLLDVQQKRCLTLSFLYLWRTKLLHGGELHIWCEDFVSSCLLDMNLNCSMNALPSHHFTKNLFTVLAMFLQTLYFNFKREGRCLQALHMGEFLHVVRCVFFNEKDNSNGISSKYPVPGKRDKFPNIISLLGADYMRKMSRLTEIKNTSV